MRTVTDLTDFTDIEDKISDWVEAASDLPEIEGQEKTYWNGFDFTRKRPYATLNIVSQSSPGKPWEERETVAGGLQTTMYAPFFWSVDINFYVDSYDDGFEGTGAAIRETARTYAQRLQNRAFLPDNQNILDAVDLSYGQLGQIVTGIQSPDEDKQIQQASVEFRFNGIAQTQVVDSDYFETVTTPDTTLSGA